MSWWDSKNWDTKGLTNLATQALKTAQKRIDKVLDIKEDEGEDENRREFLPGIYVLIFEQEVKSK